MRTRVCIIGLCIVALALCSCSGLGRTPEYSYEKEAIRITLQGDPRLNLYQGSAHTLVVCTYQLRDPNGFNQLVDERGGLSKLLECGRFDPSVAYTKRLVVQPGQSLTEKLDRAEGAKYVSVVAGYYNLTKEGTVRLYQIPVGTISQRAGSVTIDLYLGPQSIHDIKGK